MSWHAYRVSPVLRDERFELGVLPRDLRPGRAACGEVTCYRAMALRTEGLAFERIGCRACRTQLAQSLVAMEAAKLVQLATKAAEAFK